MICLTLSLASLSGAVDGSVVTNITAIVWNEVMSFAPFGSESNSSSYLQWAIPLGGISVSRADTEYDS